MGRVVKHNYSSQRFPSSSTSPVPSHLVLSEEARQLSTAGKDVPSALLRRGQEGAG